MFNLCTKYIVISRDFIWLNKTYGKYISGKENTRSDTYILKDEDKYYNWANRKIGPVKNEVKTENINIEENI